MRWACTEVMCVHRAALTNTTSTNRFVASAVDGGVHASCEEPALWRRIASATQLSAEQRADIVQLWRTFRWRPSQTRLCARPGRACFLGSLDTFYRRGAWLSAA